MIEDSLCVKVRGLRRETELALLCTGRAQNKARCVRHLASIDKPEMERVFISVVGGYAGQAA